MATTTRGGTTGRSTTTKAGKSGSTGVRGRSTSGRGHASTREVAGGYAGGFIQAVKARPLRTAAIAAGAAGASAFLWARRAQLIDQVSSLAEAISERFVEEPGAYPQPSGSSAPVQDERRASPTDPMMAEQSEVGAISY